MKTRLLSLVAIAIVATASLAASASAATTTTLGALSTAATPSPGCQPKGLWASNVSGVGSLGAGTYRYAVTANSTSAAACPSIAISVPANAGVALQWNPTPGASGYTVYRGTSDANLAPFTPGSASCPSKCVAFDAGLSTPSGSPPVLAGSSLAAGDHTDASIVQSVDYGGAAGDNSDDPVTNSSVDPSPPALKTDVIHLPGGLTANASSAAATCTLTASGASLLGSLALHGRQDPNEDTCPAGSLVGSVQALTRTPSTGSVIALMQGDIYAGVPLTGETARLLIALRPLCSFHNPIAAPNSTLCNAQLGSDLELDTAFLAAKANVVERSPGVNGIDLQMFDISTGADQPLPSALPVRNNTGIQVGALTVQVRRLTQTLFGYADQGTAATADDMPFITLPSCGVTEFTANLTTYADATDTPASTPFTALPACPIPPSTSPPAATVTTPKKKCKKKKRHRSAAMAKKKCKKKKH